MAWYAIGDVQGCAAAFDALLSEISFAPDRDRLWLVGDLVNRGPDSLGVLRRVIALGSAVTCVLGNHDLHLLAVVAGVRKLSASDTFAGVLEAPDADALVDWLRHRPLLHHDEETRRVLVHAGIPPPWTVADALEQAAEIERLLQRADWRDSLRSMYGNEPSIWSDALPAEDRRRYTINALTRMRYCDASGRLDLEHSGPPGSQPAALMPWFDVPARRARDAHIVFGHWAALGLLRREDVTALDTGCVWGNSLTAVRLDGSMAPARVRCAQSTTRARPA